MTFGCEPVQRRATALALGALSNLTRLDTAFSAIPGAVRGVHWALAGASTDVVCEMGVPAAMDLAVDASLGYAGGWAVSYLRRTGYIPF